MGRNAFVAIVGHGAFADEGVTYDQQSAEQWNSKFLHAAAPCELSVRKHMIRQSGVEAEPGTVRIALPHLRESAFIPSLIRCIILVAGQTMASGSAKEFTADKRRDERRSTEMLSDHDPIQSMTKGTGIPVNFR